MVANFGNNILDSPNSQSVELFFTPFRLVSLLDMLRFYADKFVKLTGFVVHIQTISESNPNETLKPQDDDPLLVEFGELRTLCQELELGLSIKSIDRIIGKFSNQEVSATDVEMLLGNLIERIEDELSSVYVMTLSRKKAEDYYEKTNLFGDIVSNNFPSASFDIEEAGKCFATARNTACVMHLQRALEVGVKAHTTALGLTLKTASWGSMLKATGDEVASRSKNSSWSSVTEKDFFEGVQPLLHSVKVAWRNPSMHADKQYDEERAQEIFNAVKGFMRNLAEHLNEKGKFRKISKK